MNLFACILEEHKNTIVTKLTEYVMTEHPDRTTEYTKCFRDLSYMFDTLCQSLHSNNIELMKNFAYRFWLHDKRMIVSYDVEFIVYDMLHEEVVALTDDISEKEFVAECIDTVKNIIINGRPKDFVTQDEDSWKKMVRARHSWPVFKEDPIDKSVIEEIIDEMYHFMPSKQSKFPFFVKVFDWSDPDIRHHIMLNCHRDPDDPVEIDEGNPQVLAPWLVAFSCRTPDESELDENTEFTNPSSVIRQGQLEIGIASSFLAYACEARGIQTGFCGCITRPDLLAENIGMPDGWVSLFMGIGYADREATDYLDPRTNTRKEVSTSNFYHKFKQIPKERFIEWH